MGKKLILGSFLGSKMPKLPIYAPYQRLQEQLKGVSTAEHAAGLVADCAVKWWHQNQSEVVLKSKVQIIRMIIKLNTAWKTIKKANSHTKKKLTPTHFDNVEKIKRKWDIHFG